MRTRREPDRRCTSGQLSLTVRLRLTAKLPCKQLHITAPAIITDSISELRPI